jgi:hypothetical protein
MILPPQAGFDDQRPRGTSLAIGEGMTAETPVPMSVRFPSTISPAQHAVLDYGVVATYFSLGFKLLNQNRAAATLAFLNAGMVLGMSVMTDYPGGLFRTLSFRAHRTGDILQAGLAALGPVLLGFAGEPEAKYFYGQAVSEVGVIAATDWDAVNPS